MYRLVGPGVCAVRNPTRLVRSTLTVLQVVRTVVMVKLLRSLKALG